MKKEKYFRDELQHMFIYYAIVPAVIFTLLCGVVFMVALIHGRRSITVSNNGYVAGELERVLGRYEEGLVRLAGQPDLFTGTLDTRRKAGIFEGFYGMTNGLEIKGNLYILDRDRNILLSSQPGRPEYLDVKEGTSWGIFWHMDRWPGQTAVKLVDGWKSQQGAVALGRSVESEGQTVGYVVCSIPSSQMQKMLDRLETQTIITDSYGWVYACSNYHFVNKSNQVLGALSGAGRFLSHDRQMYLAARQPAYRQLFQVYSISDIQNIVISLSLSSALVITALILMTLWMLLRSRKMTEKKTEDFYRILDVMENARTGNLETSIRIDSENEFRIIADAYNETIASLKTQMENNRKMTELVAMAQNKQLESQFNPHFLYNTLENIRYMCRLEPATAERMVFSLSNLLRYSLDGSKDQVTLKEDLEHLENYMTILKRRFGSRLEYQIEVEPEAMDCRIPKLVLQPMIENAVKYGFGSQLNLKVELKAYIYQGNLIMICRDDGVGISQENLSELNAVLEQKENTSRHSGLYNIHRRIAILYGRPYGVEIRSTEGHGTTLVVTLPADREPSWGPGA